MSVYKRLLKSGRILFPAIPLSLTRFCERFGARSGSRMSVNSIVRNRITRVVCLIFQSSTLSYRVFSSLPRRDFLLSFFFFYHFFSPFIRSVKFRGPERAVVRTHVLAFRNYGWTRPREAGLQRISQSFILRRNVFVEYGSVYLYYSRIFLHFSFC